MQPSMGFCQSIKNVICKNYANFNDRARRREFWYFFLFMFLINSFMLILITIIFFSFNFFNKVLIISTILLIAEFIFIAFNLAFFIPYLAVCVRRLHDIGKSGCFILLVLIPLVGGFILLYFMCVDSQPSTNEYGPSPKYGVNQTDSLIGQNCPIYASNPADTYPIQQEPNQNLIYQQPSQNPVP